MCCSFTGLQAQCEAVACNDQVQISLDEMCMGVTPDMFLEGGFSDVVIIEITAEDGTTARGVGPTHDSEFLNEDGTSFDWSPYVGQTIRYKLISDCDGNSCWGEATMELNLFPDLNSPCEYIPGSVVTFEGEIGGANDPTLEVDFVVAEDCQSIDIRVVHNLKWNCGTHGNPIWCDAGISIDIRGPSGAIISTTLAAVNAQGVVSFAPGFLALGDYTMIISASDAAGDTDGIANAADASGTITGQITYSTCTGGCFTYCSEEGSQAYPDEFITVEEIYSLIDMGCFADIEGDINVVTQKSGTSCEGLTVVEFFATFSQHGELVKKLLLTQAFETHPFILSNVFIPETKDVDCAVTDYSPAALAQLEGYGPTFAYPYILDTHNPGTIVTTICPVDPVLSHEEVPVDTVEEMVLIGTQWVLLPVVIKDLIEVYICPVDSVEAEVPLPPRVIPITDKYCNIIATYSDTEYEACGGGRKVFRKWKLIDWCSGQQSEELAQIFEVRDILPPVLDPIDDIIASVEPWTCAAAVDLPTVHATDNCGTNEITWIVSEGRVVDGKIVDLWMGAGPFEVVAIIGDDCDNTVRDTFNIAVVDQVKPVAVCQDRLNVTLSGGLSKIYKESFDNGSHDAGCGDVFVTVRRQDGCCGEECEMAEVCLQYDPKTGECISSEMQPVGDAFGEYVKFCCTDAGQIIVVEVKIEDESGNETYCWVDVLVEDKGSAQCIVPDVTINCLDDIHDLELTGSPNLSETCEVPGLLYKDLGNIDGCGAGEYQRTWYFDLDGDGEITDVDRAGCTQTIYVSNEYSFNPNTIKWPKHYTGKTHRGLNVECADLDGDGLIDEVEEIPFDVPMGETVTCVPDDIGDKPEWCETSCGLVGFTVNIDTIAGGDACLKIIKHWTVIDWCTWDPNAENTDDENDTDYDQFVAIVDWAQGVCADCTNGYGPVIDNSVYFRYQQVDVDGYYTYDQVIKVVDDEDPIVTAPDDLVVNSTGGATSKDDDTECVGSDILTATAEDFCGGVSTGANLLNWVIYRYENGELVAQKSEQGASATMGTGEGSPGDEHVVRFVVVDGCGNQSSAQTTITFEDDHNPTPFCITGLTTAFMSTDGTATIWASDYDFGSFDNCCDAETLEFSIVESGVTPIRPGEDGFGTQSSLIFTCDDIQSTCTSSSPGAFDYDGSFNFPGNTNISAGDAGCSANAEIRIADINWGYDIDVSGPATADRDLPDSDGDQSVLILATPLDQTLDVAAPNEVVIDFDVCQSNVKFGIADIDFADAIGIKGINSNGDTVFPTMASVSGVTESWVAYDPTTNTNVNALPQSTFNTANPYPGYATLVGGSDNYNDSRSTALLDFGDEVICEIKIISGFLDTDGWYDAPDTDEFAPIAGQNQSNGFVMLSEFEIPAPSNTSTNNVRLLDVWVWDCVGNGDFCSVQLLIEDNSGVCGDVETDTGDGSSAMISGDVQTETGSMVENVEVSINAPLAEYPATMITAGNGLFSFPANPMGFNYTVQAAKDANYMNGVSTFDLVLIQKHILGLDRLDSPYKVIAADINSDERVSSIDLVQLRKLILGVYNDLPDNESWRFVDADQQFSDAYEPFPFTERIFVTNLTRNELSEDFIGVKIGDVSGNAVSSGSFAPIDTRSNGSLVFKVQDETVEAGQLIKLDVTSENFQNVFGYQFTLMHEGLTFDHIDAGVLEIDESHIGIRENSLTMSWADVSGKSSSDVLFSLYFKADAHTSLLNSLSVNSSITNAEAYVGEDMIHKSVSLEFTNQKGDTAGFVLYQNEPNPFDNKTSILFNLPESGAATISIHDITGKLLKLDTKLYNKGLNAYEVNSSDIKATGILYYQVESGNFSATKKMILID